jgi:hypothetical protein
LILPHSIRRPVSNLTSPVALLLKVAPEIIPCPVGQGIPYLVGPCVSTQLHALFRALAKPMGPLTLEAVNVVLKSGPNLPCPFNLLQ